ncbi:MAG: MBL fold metallo-hydrolase [Clostridia bacterium]|nr:MBL fold metallo-hydrolase [Clostridia bacterium]
MIYCPLFSGSSGNCGYLSAGGTRVLVDAGLSGRQIGEALSSVGGSLEGVQGIVITHEHSDHVKGAGILSRKYHIPIYANEGTWNAMARALGKVDPSLRRIFVTGEDFYIGDITVQTFDIPHDAADPVGFRFYHGRSSVSVATDMGYVRPSVLKAVAGSDLVLWESNHDIDMLRGNPRYSLALKQRILGRHGHLSNEASADGVLRLMDTGVRQVVLGHLSGENNTPEKAMEVSLTALVKAGAVVGSDIGLDMAWRDRPGNVYTLD